MIFYAILHKPTGKYMPAVISRCSSGGYTWWEPTGIDGLGGKSAVPRLFTTKAYANVALKHWLKGPVIARTDDWGDRTQRVIPPEQERRPEDMRIVSFNLTEIT